MNANYDKELLLDFIEWLSVSHGSGIFQDSYIDIEPRPMSDAQVLEWVDQYLEDDE